MNKLKGYNMNCFKLIQEVMDFNKFVNSGRANDENVKEDDVDAKELEMGIDIEKEHTTDKEIAKRIALDHLAEIPDYYARLNKMEKEATK